MADFDTTRWSLILAAREPTAAARGALESLCRIYRPAVRDYIASRGYRTEAEDLTQGFFLHFLEQDLSGRAERERGRFRAYLLTAVRNFLASSARARGAARRGGDEAHAALDEVELAGDDGPEHAFDRAWALALLQHALERLAAEAADSGRGAQFERLRGFLVEAPDTAEYERAATDLGLRRNTLAVAVHRLRQRLQQIVREPVLDTVAAADDAEADAEIGALRRLLVAPTPATTL